MRKRTDGFTLVELMVVVLVIGILVAVAVPVFKAAKTNAEKSTCQSFQRTWAGVVEQIRANGDEPSATTYGYKRLASGVDQSQWFDKAIPTYLKSVSACPSAAGAAYWVRDAGAGHSGNGDILACAGAAAVSMASADGHPLYEVPRPHRYWRIYALDQSWSRYNWSNYTIWATSISFFVSSDGSGTDLCYRLTDCPEAISSSENTSAATYDHNANDNDRRTSFQTATSCGPNQWWGVDLGAEYANEVHSVSLATGEFYPMKIALQWSDTGAEGDWHTQTTKATPPKLSAPYAVITDL